MYARTNYKYLHVYNHYKNINACLHNLRFFIFRTDLLEVQLKVKLKQWQRTGSAMPTIERRTEERENKKRDEQSLQGVTKREDRE